MDKIFTVAVVGPTASGKTELAVRLAERLDGEIVSADSMQIYKGMDVAVAMPTGQERARAVHHMIDFLEPSERFSVADYVSRAKKCIEDIHSRGKTPVICGGTGLYVDSLLRNIGYVDDGFDSGVRQRLSLQYDELGGEHMLSLLKQVDAESAAKLHANDKKRIVRALELIELTGKTKTVQNELSLREPSPYEVCYIGLTAKDRQFLYDRINRRVDLMLQNGLERQAREFFTREDAATAAQAIGYKELKPYIDGECSLSEAVETLKMRTRQYAKRQLTWFRRNPDIEWLYIDENNTDELTNEALKKIEGKKREVYGS